MIILLYATGIGFPVVYLLFHGELRETSTVAATAFWVKQLLVLGLVAIQFYGTFVLNPRCDCPPSASTGTHVLGEGLLTPPLPGPTGLQSPLRPSGQAFRGGRRPAPS
ncbi:MAG: hypothetical protein GW911_18330 [Armatimonadetes bacterium]|nr:hypothetical protein [Armatimonadota bacterium]NCO95005.1 hypothetical protein [Armatimonadota bacterium]NCP34473.1 hypothetical protein [Armatimonadota bacterium]NDK13988.1 hypothetical protein [Armatimonadota bacterium]